jgi:hypothetical protein
VLAAATSGAFVVADNRDQALAILDQAIKARGGEEALGRARMQVRMARGSTFLEDKEFPFTEELRLDLPFRLRHAVELGGPQRGTVLHVLAKDRGWQATGGAVADVSRQQFDELREEAWVAWMTTLAPLKDKDVVLQMLPEEKVNDQPAVGIKASVKGHAELKLYFDRKTWLLVKLDRKTQEEGLEFRKETLYSEYKEFDGIKMPTRIVEIARGKKVLELTVREYRFPEKHDEATFAKP